MKTFKVSENIVMYAFRYALGRKTGTVSEVVSYLRENWERLQPFTRNEIQSEIRTAIGMGMAGSDCDIEEWKKLL